MREAAEQMKEENEHDFGSISGRAGRRDSGRSADLLCADVQRRMYDAVPERIQFADPLDRKSVV